MKTYAGLRKTYETVVKKLWYRFQELSESLTTHNARNTDEQLVANTETTTAERGASRRDGRSICCESNSPRRVFSPKRGRKAAPSANLQSKPAVKLGCGA